MSTIWFIPLSTRRLMTRWYDLLFLVVNRAFDSGYGFLLSRNYC